MKRRKMAKDYAVERVRLLAMKRNDVLPIEIRVSEDPALIISIPYA